MFISTYVVKSLIPECPPTYAILFTRCESGGVGLDCDHFPSLIINLQQSSTYYGPK
jgi:hypothetical protein